MGYPPPSAEHRIQNTNRRVAVRDGALLGAAKRLEHNETPVGQEPIPATRTNHDAQTCFSFRREQSCVESALVKKKKWGIKVELKLRAQAGVPPAVYPNGMRAEDRLV